MGEWRMKKASLAAALAACLLLLGGCGALEDALREAGERFEADRIATPQSSGGDIDWSFVPVVRELATGTFAESFPDAQIVGTNVASVNGRDERVIVVVQFEFESGKSGEYGFDYEKNAQGEYELKRYGEGVEVEDLH